MTVSPSRLPALHLLGVPSLSSLTGQTARRLERKAAGLLAFLALEGATARTTVAGLLWPESSETKARSNLRQTLHRLRELTQGAEVVGGDDLLQLHPEVSIDLAQLELAAFNGHDTQVLAFDAELLGSYLFDDCPEFMDWLSLQRERLAGLRRDALLRLAGQEEQSGEYRLALRRAEALLELDPVSEVAHRLTMRLHYLSGDRGAALRAFERCQVALERELGVTPMPETLELARQIEQENQVAPAEAPARPALPLSVQRPPRLVGRHGVWAQMEDAWAAGQAILISGAAGVGKSRLAQDFLTSKGTFLRLEGRPGDSQVPYSSHMRLFRTLLTRIQDVTLPEWVALELSRLLPELAGPSWAGGTPLQGSEGLLRFHQAQLYVVAQALERGLQGILLDDLHYVDHASFEAGLYVFTQLQQQSPNLRLVGAFRQGELPAAFEHLLMQSVDAQQAVHLQLPALNEQALTELLDSLKLNLPAGLGSRLSRHTGGNPLFVLETLRTLLESGELERGLPTTLPLPDRIGPLIIRRLKLLSAPALRLSQVAALAEQDFSLELASSVLEAPLLNLGEPLAELEAAQVMQSSVQGTVFTHDLVAQAARSTLPVPIRTLLHRRVASYLTEHLAQTGTEAARIAGHWAQAGDQAQAAPWWLKAGQAALNRGADRDAGQAFEQALQGFAAGQAGRLEALLGLGQALLSSDPDRAHLHLSAALAEAQQGQAIRHEVQVHAALSEWHLLRGQLEASHQAILHALKLVPAEMNAEQRREVSELWRARFWVELRSGRLSDAEQAIASAMRLAPDHPWLANERALLLWHSGRFLEAAQLYEGLLTNHDDEAAQGTLPWIANNMAWTYWALARNDEAASLLKRSLEQPGAPFDEGLRRSNLSVILTSLGCYAEALDNLDTARTLLRGYNLNMADVLYRIGVVHYRADHRAQALDHFQQAATLARQVGDLYRLTYTLASQSVEEALHGDLTSAQAHVQEAQAIAAQIQFPLATIIAAQAASEVERLAGHPDLALRHAQNATALARACGMPEQIGHSLLYAAQFPGPHVEEALREALRIGQEHQLPALVWRAAQALGQQELARDTLDSLRQHSPPGWFT